MDYHCHTLVNLQLKAMCGFTCYIGNSGALDCYYCTANFISTKLSLYHPEYNYYFCARLTSEMFHKNSWLIGTD